MQYLVVATAVAALYEDSVVVTSAQHHMGLVISVGQSEAQSLLEAQVTSLLAIVFTVTAVNLVKVHESKVLPVGM